MRIFTLDAATDPRTFAERFRKEVQPVYSRYGFELEGGWISTSQPEGLTRGAGKDGSIPWIAGPQNRYIYIVTYEGPEPWQAKIEEFYASPDYAAVPPDLQQRIVDREFMFVERTLPR
jgi:hypothetical protein